MTKRKPKTMKRASKPVSQLVPLDELTIMSIRPGVLVRTIVKRQFAGKPEFWAYDCWECPEHLAKRFKTQEATHNLTILNATRGRYLRVLAVKRPNVRTKERCAQCAERDAKRAKIVRREKAEREARNAAY